MVTIQQARQQLVSARQKLTQQEEATRATVLPERTAAQLRKVTMTGQVRYKAERPKQEAALQKAKEGVLKKIKEAREKIIKPYEEEILIPAERKQAAQKAAFQEKVRQARFELKRRQRAFKEQQKKDKEVLVPGDASFIKALNIEQKRIYEEMKKGPIKIGSSISYLVPRGATAGAIQAQRERIEGLTPPKPVEIPEELRVPSFYTGPESLKFAEAGKGPKTLGEALSKLVVKPVVTPVAAAIRKAGEIPIAMPYVDIGKQDFKSQGPTLGGKRVGLELVKIGDVTGALAKAVPIASPKRAIVGTIATAAIVTSPEFRAAQDRKAFLRETLRKAGEKLDVDLTKRAPVELQTAGEFAKDVDVFFEKGRELAAAGQERMWYDIGTGVSKITKDPRDIKVGRMIGKGAGKVAGVVPEVSAFVAAPYLMAGKDVFAAEQKMIEVDKEIVRIQEAQIKQTKLDRDAGRLIIPEGSELTDTQIREQLTSAEETQKLREQLISGAKLQRGIGLGILGAGAVGVTYRAATKPIIVRPKPIQFYREYQFPKSKKTTYELFQYRAPVEKTTLIRKSLGLKPSAYLTKPQIDIITPSSYVTAGKPYTAYVAKVSKVPYGIKKPIEEIPRLIAKAKITKGVKIAKISGKGTIIESTKLVELPKPISYTAGKLFPKGVRVAPQKLYVGGLKVKPITPFGKSTKQFLTVSEIYPKGTLGPVKFYRGETAFKTIGTGVPRAAGKVQVLKGTIVQFPGTAPPRTVVGLPKKIVGPTGYPLPQLTQQVTKPFVITKPPVIIPKPIQLISKPTTTKVITTKLAKEGIPTMVGGTGLIEIPYSGTGLYERMGVGSVLIKPRIIPGEVTPVLLSKTQITPQLVDVTKIQIIQTPKVISGSGQTPTQILTPTQVPKVIPKVIPKVVPKIIPKVVPKIVPGIAIPKQIIPTEPVLRVTKPVIKPFSVSKVFIKRRKPTGIEQRYTPFVRRYGVWRPYGKPTTRKKAIRKGVSVVRGTLGASLKIVGTKTKKAIPFAKETKEFRFGKKKGAKVLVQRKGKRLSDIGERVEIMRAKRGIKFI